MAPSSRYFSDRLVTERVKRAAKTASRFQKQGAKDQTRDLKVTYKMDMAFYELRMDLERRGPHRVPRSFSNKHVANAKRQLRAQGGSYGKDARWKVGRVRPHQFSPTAAEVFLEGLDQWKNHFAAVILSTAGSNSERQDPDARGWKGKKRLRQEAKRSLIAYLVGANHRNLWTLNPNSEIFEVIAFAGGFGPPGSAPTSSTSEERITAKRNSPLAPVGEPGLGDPLERTG